MPTAPPLLDMSPLCHFILASASPRRREFLEALGVPFTVVLPNLVAGGREIDETPLPDEPPADLVQRLSRAKAQVVVDNLPTILPSINIRAGQNIAVIAADTIVVLDGYILGKPGAPAEAVSMLKQLRQRPHHVYSGITVARSGRFVTRLGQSAVWMRAYTNAEINAYVAGGSPLDKAGAYSIQDKNFAPVERLEGCFAGVMGLPLGALADALAELGLSFPRVGPVCARHTGAVCCQNSNIH